MTATDRAPDSPEVVVSGRRGGATDDEIAAVVAVLTDAYERERASAVADEPRPDGWALSIATPPRLRDRRMGWRAFGG